MQSPDVITTLVDKANGVTYKVVAYRSLDRAELIETVRHFVATLKKKPKRGTEFKILTVIS